MPQQTENERKKLMNKLLFPAIIAGLILVVLGYFTMQYFNNDHSIYSKLSLEEYTQHGLSFMFDYPVIMKSSSSLVQTIQTNSNQQLKTTVAYTYGSGTNKIELYEDYLTIKPILSQLNLSPSQFVSQIHTMSGSYINLLRKTNPSLIDGLYVQCNSLVHIDGKAELFCVTTHSSTTQATVIGTTDTYEYNLHLIMSNKIWNQHASVWKRVENSFTYH